MRDGHNLTPGTLTIDLNKEVSDELIEKVIESPKVDRIFFKNNFLGEQHIDLLKRLNQVFLKRPEVLFELGSDRVKFLDYMPDLRAVFYRGNEWPEFAKQMLDRGNITRLWLWMPDASKKGPDIAFITNFSDTLKELWLKYISVNAYESISQLTALKKVILESPKLPDLKCICASPVEELELLGSRISDISDIEKLKGLRYLRITNNKLVEDVSFISSLPHLEYIQFQIVPKITKWPKCDHLLKLQTIWLEDCKQLKDRTEYENWEKSRIGKPESILSWRG